MKYTTNERIAIVRILLEMMNVDGEVALEEILYFGQLKKMMDITKDDFVNGKNINLLVSLLVIKEMPDEKKFSVGLMLHQMLNADGKATVSELKLFNMVCDTTGIGDIISRL
jgi:uncharacterized tellurite resistance protein B-like protein